MRIDLHPEARAEFRSGALWYEERRDSFGDEFIAAVTTTLHHISAATEPVIRKTVVERFPYLIAFEQPVLARARKPRCPVGKIGNRSVRGHG